MFLHRFNGLHSLTVNEQAEGYWPAEAVLDMLQKVDELSESSKQPSQLALPSEAEVTPAEVAV